MTHADAHIQKEPSGAKSGDRYISRFQNNGAWTLFFLVDALDPREHVDPSNMTPILCDHCGKSAKLLYSLSNSELDVVLMVAEECCADACGGWTPSVEQINKLRETVDQDPPDEWILERIEIIAYPWVENGVETMQPNGTCDHCGRGTCCIYEVTNATLGISHSIAEECCAEVCGGWTPSPEAVQLAKDEAAAL